MFKKVMLGGIAVLSVVFAVAASEGERPVVEFIKDGEVVKSRQMYDQEFEAYTEINRLEQKMDGLHKPLEAVEAQMHDKAQALELAVQILVQKSMAGEDRYQAEEDKDAAVLELQTLTSQMKPAVREIKAVAGEIKRVAKVFKSSMADDLNDGDIDAIRISGPDGKQSVWLNRSDDEDMDFDEDFDEDMDFDL